MPDIIIDKPSLGKGIAFARKTMECWVEPDQLGDIDIDLDAIHITELPAYLHCLTIREWPIPPLTGTPH